MMLENVEAVNWHVGQLATSTVDLPAEFDADEEASQPAEAPKASSTTKGIRIKLGQRHTILENEDIIDIQTAVLPESMGHVPHAVTVTGDCSFESDVSISGALIGTITAANGTVTIQATGIVMGSIRARTVIVQGVLKADVDVSRGCLALASTAVCEGHVVYERISIEDGAVMMATTKKVNRHVEMNGPCEAARLTQSV